VARIPPHRIVLLGHSLGTQVASAVAAHHAVHHGIEFAGVVLVAGFPDMASLLTSYAIGGWVPLLSPLRAHATLQRWYMGCVVDRWNTAGRIGALVRHSRRLRLFLLHARDDYEIPWGNSDALFAVAANATSWEETEGRGMEGGLIERLKKKRTRELGVGSGGWESTWNDGRGRRVVQRVVPFGGHNRVTTYADLGVLVLRAFGFGEGSEEGKRGLELDSDSLVMGDW
jgi:abhydrolase domain-containing protein 12